MKKMIIPAIAALVVSGAQAKTADERIKELEQRIETLEYKSYENYFTFGGRLENQYEHIQSSDEGEVANYDYYSTLFQLDIAAQPNDEVSFYGRLSMNKFWNDAQKQGDYSDNTMSQGRSKNDTTPYVERAFINYRMLPSLTLSVGRLPTIDGTPTHYSMGQSSMGSYPAFSYGTVLDGIALTHSAKLMGGTLTSRAVYTPFTLAEHGDLTSPTEAVDSEGVKADSVNHMIAVMADYEKYNTSFADRMSFLIQGVLLDGLSLADEDTKLSGLDVYDDSKSNVVVDLKKVIAAMELNNIFKSKFDFAAQVAWSEVKSEGSMTRNILMDSTSTVPVTGMPNLPTLAVYPYNLGGVFSDANGGTSTGWAYLASLRYNATNNLKIGYEYVQATDKAFMMTGAKRRAVSFYNTPSSKGHHAYVNYRLNNNLTLLLGYSYQQIDTTYTQGLFGAGESIDREVHSGYTNLIATF